jgi:magnesium transporter
MITRHERGALTWIDLESPTREELQGVIAEFSIDPRIEEEMISPTPYPITIAFPEYLYLILHFPTAAPDGGARNQEVDFIVGKNFLITARYEVIEPIHNLHKVFEAEELLGLSKKAKVEQELLERVLGRMYAAISGEVEMVGRSLEHIERDIFSGRERETVRTVSETGRILLRFQTILARHEEPLKEFLDRLASPAFLGKGFAENAAHIEAQRAHAAALVTSFRAVARELHTTNDSLLNATQNEVIKRLTIMSFIALPLTLIASIFGMNAEHMPLVHDIHGFWLVIGIMLAAALGLFGIFKLKKLL